jgi:hypothetical protein
MEGLESVIDKSITVLVGLKEAIMTNPSDMNLFIVYKAMNEIDMAISRLEECKRLIRDDKDEVKNNQSEIGQ